MNNLSTSFIRTVVPFVVGAALNYLAARGVNLDAETAAQVSGLLTAILGGVYYVTVRLLEAKYPKLGYLLGTPTPPKYEK